MEVCIVTKRSFLSCSTTQRQNHGAFNFTSLNDAILQLPRLSVYELCASISLSVTQSAFASTSDRPLCFPRACVGLIGPRPSDYPHALSACYYFLPAVFLLALGLWSSLPARQLSLDTSYSFLTFSVFFFVFFFFKVLKG